MSRGKLIAVEGIEGAGLTTATEAIVAFFRSLSLPVVQTREVGGTPNAEIIREILLGGKADRWSPLAEAFLVNAARADHVEKFICPNLEAGQWIVSDRFVWSTQAYQGGHLRNGAPTSLIESMNARVVNFDAGPSFTILLDVPAEVGLQRVFMNGERNRFEDKPIEYHEGVRQRYLDMARRAPPIMAKCIDATQSLDKVLEDVLSAVAARFGLPHKTETPDD